jgi:hypothetical protein
MRPNKHLAKFAHMGQKGLEPSWAPGSYVGRGFADLGHEEFYVLPGARLLALATGAITQVGDAEKRFFYWLPTLDEMVNALLERAWVVSELVHSEQRQWQLTLRALDSDDCLVFSNEFLELVLVDGLSAVVAPN